MFSVTVADAAASYSQSINEIVAKVAGGLLHVGRIYYEPAIREYARGREIMDRFLAADLVKVPSHWNIPELHGD